MEKKSRAEKASEFFRDGYNCSQSVVLAFAEDLHIDKETLTLISSSFGGGMGRLRLTCGAVTGMFMIAGILCGSGNPKDEEAKAELYKTVQELATAFKEKHGTITCRELLNLNLKENKADDYVPAKRTESYYASRPCEQFVYDSAEIIEARFGELLGEV